MKKFFLKGKSFLSKKLEELDIESEKIDFISEQLPNRLKQPLSVIRSNEIDLEDANLYETYFKNYPNHHLSHFLIDKYNMMKEAQLQPQPYTPPNHVNQHIPHFDKKKEHDALLFRQAVQDCEEGYSSFDEPLLCICVINFHHKRGTQVEYRYPQNETVLKIQNNIIHHAMPDSSHNKDEDYNFFNFEENLKGRKQMLFGVSFFKQIKLTEEMKKSDPELTRSHVQKAIAIVSRIPLFGYINFRLSFTTKMFFEEITNFSIIEESYKEISKNLAEVWPSMDISSLYIGTDIANIVKLFGIQKIYQIWKAILYERRVVVFSNSSSANCSFILSLISLFPGLSTFGIYSKPISKYMQSLRQFALPLKTFNTKNFLALSFHIQDFNMLQNFRKSDEGHFLLGTTNQLLKQPNQYGIEMLINLQNCSVQKKKSREPWESLNKKQKGFLSQLQEIIKNQKLETHEEKIRNCFHNFLKRALIDIIISIKSFRKFVKDCEEYVKNQGKKKEEKVKPKASDYQLVEEELDNSLEQEKETEKDQIPLLPTEVAHIIFPTLLLHKSFTYFLQFHNEHLPDIVVGNIFPSLYINNYDYLFRVNQEEFIAYNWLQKKLTFGKGAAKDFQGKQIQFSKDNQKLQAKSIYIGAVVDRKFSQHGFYMDEFDHYEGEYLRGIKEGYGKYSNSSEKYIGNFHNNLYDGEGQLITSDNIYAGQFQQGIRHGHGRSQGKLNFEGEWENDKPVYPENNEKDNEKNQQEGLEENENKKHEGKEKHGEQEKNKE